MLVYGPDDKSTGDECCDAFKKQMKYRWLNEDLLAQRKEQDRDFDAKFSGEGVFHSAGDKGHTPWLW